MIEFVKNFNYSSSTEDDKVNLMLEIINLSDDDLYENLEFILDNITSEIDCNEYITIFSKSERIFDILWEITELNHIHQLIYNLKDYKKFKNKGKVKKLKIVKEQIKNTIKFIGNERLKDFNEYFTENKVKKILYEII